jgi:uncharacterized protein YciI
MSRRIPRCFVFKLIPPRPTFDLDMSEEEAAIMARHATYWTAMMQEHEVLIYGPVRDSGGAWGLGVIASDSESEVRAIAEDDPAITSGMATYEVGTMAVAIVRN